ncbi:peptidoglycan-binding domain-containing protein [Ruegeria jejuensis]|uniref:peptidoglycan-binding domain-containing protein n=1 Tax=Ruegeria jejuensis TaxID=3233338 RepID=UPI00355B5FCB
MKTLKKGAKGTKVKELQGALNKAGARPKLKTDGKFGDKTETAVKIFQKKSRLKRSGVACEKTLTALGLAGKTRSWPLDDVLPDRREVDKHYVNARKIVKATIALASKHKAYSITKLKEEMQKAGKTLDKVYAGVVDPLSDIGFAEHKFDQLPFSEVRKREALIAQAKKKLGVFSDNSGIFYGHIIDIGRIESETKSAIDKRSRVVWPVPNYYPVFKRNLRRLEAVKERMQEIQNDCYKHENPEVSAFADKAHKVFSATDNAYVSYEAENMILNDIKREFELNSKTMRDDDLLKIGERGKKQYQKLRAEARICIDHLKKCWEIEKHHRKLIGFAV